MASQKYYTLFQLQKSIRRLIEERTQEYWITAEIAQVQLPGHAYLELVHKEEDQVTARARAIIWREQLLELYERLGPELTDLLRPGFRVLAKVAVRYHEVHGFSLLISDLDATYTVGELALRREQTLKRLQAEGLADLQRLLPLPAVVQHLAVISSKEAAGLADFIAQLEQNPYNIRFSVRVFYASVQGEQALAELPLAFGQVRQWGQAQAIVLIRGGGSRMDLEIFDRYEVAAAVATAAVPVLTGIGHHKDQSLADLMAWQAFKTPTAVAEFLLHRVLQFYSQLSESYRQVLLLARTQAEVRRVALESQHRSVSRQAQSMLQRHQANLLASWSRFGPALRMQVRQQQARLEMAELRVESLAPDRLFRRGYTLTLTPEGHLPDPTHLAPGDRLLTYGAGWQAESIIRLIKPLQNEQKDNPA